MGEGAGRSGGRGNYSCIREKNLNLKKKKKKVRV